MSPCHKLSQSKPEQNVVIIQDRQFIGGFSFRPFKSRTGKKILLTGKKGQGINHDRLTRNDTRMSDFPLNRLPLKYPTST